MLYIYCYLNFYINNYHYYSLFIPEGDKIIIEFQGRNVQGFLKHGIIKINPFLGNAFYIKPDSPDSDLEDEKLIITIDKSSLNIPLENQYISFVFCIFENSLASLKNYYYFRIIQDNYNNHIIYPLDTNKANICRTTSIGTTNVCYFLLKNDYKELYYNYSLFAYGLDEVDYDVWYINDKITNYYSINISSIIKNYEKEHKEKGYFKVPIKNNTKFILIEIKSKYIETLNVHFNFDGEFIPSPSIDIYSYQIFYLKDKIKKDYYFNLDFPGQYIIFMNNTSGEGDIYLNQSYNEIDKKIYISNDKVFSYTISKEIRSIHIFSENDLFFLLKIKNKMDNKVSQELNYGTNIIIQKEMNAYYVKDLDDKGLDIHFNLDYDSDLLESYYHHYLEIEGYYLPFDDFKYITKDNLLNIFYSKPLYKDFYKIVDLNTNNGLIVFDKDTSENQSDKNDNYFLFFLDFYDEDEAPIDIEISSEIFVESRFEKILEKNKYFRGYFNLLNNNIIQNITYIIQISKEKNINNKIYILEFSSNFKYIEIIFNDDFNYYDKRINGGVQQFFISGEKLLKEKNYYFIV